MIKNWVKNRINDRGLFLEKATERKDIEALINSLHPQDVGIDLIRIGGDQDGAYLVPNDLAEIEACFSPGVGGKSYFEKDCSERGMKIFLADKSVEKPLIEDENFNFIPKFIGPSTNEDYITLDDWVNSTDVKSDSDLLLQMDIEAFEYYTILNVSNQLLDRCRIIVIEFHRLWNLWNPDFFELAKLTFDKLLQNHTCLHIHPNNAGKIYEREGIELPLYMEFTFIRNDRFVSKKPQTKFPLDLDITNTDYPSMPLPKNWYS